MKKSTTNPLFSRINSSPIFNPATEECKFCKDETLINEDDPLYIHHLSLHSPIQHRQLLSLPSENDLILSDEMTVKDRQDAINQSHPFGIKLWKSALYKKYRTIQNISFMDVHQSIDNTFKDLYFISVGNLIWSLAFGWWLLAIYSVLALVIYLLTLGTINGYKYSCMVFDLGRYLFWPFGNYVQRRPSSTWSSQDNYISRPSSPFQANIKPQMSDRSTSGHQISSNNFAIPSDSNNQASSSNQQFNSASSTVKQTSQFVNRTSANSSKSTINKKLRFSHLSKKPLPPIPMSTTSWLINFAYSIVYFPFNMWKNLRKVGYSGFVYYLLFSLIIAPIQFLVSAICWLIVIGIPMAKLNSALIHHLYNEPLAIHFHLSKTNPSSMTPTNPESDPLLPAQNELLLCTYKAFALHYYKYTYDGINIIFINLISIVLFALFDAFWLAEKLDHQGIGHPLVVFSVCLIAVMPLSYYIGMAVASISSQSSFGMGAVINASFGSIVEIILYSLAITKEKGKLVEGAIIGSFLGALLLLPGVSMIAGGVGKWKEQTFNVKSAGVSTVLLILALIGVFTPTLFNGVFGKYDFNCDINNNNQTSTGISSSGCKLTLPTRIGSTEFYLSHVRPLMYTCAIILPTAYLIGLWFTLRTHVKQIYHHEDVVDHTNVKKLNVFERIGNAISKQIRSQKQPILRPSEEEPVLIDDVSNAPGDIEQNVQLPEENVLSDEEDDEQGGHDAPEWSKFKSTLILLASTIAFSLLAEELVDGVDEVLGHSNISEKFLGLTLFALVPNVPEFMNAIAFAMYGNVALSLEIGSAYSIQISNIQIPILVAFSAIYNHIRGKMDSIENAFTLIFPMWDMYSVFFAVFLLSYTYIEGKSHYFKGSVLSLTYLLIIMSFWFAPKSD